MILLMFFSEDYGVLMEFTIWHRNFLNYLDLNYLTHVK